MSRDALVVGINIYRSEGLPNLKSAAQEAETIAQCLEQYGHFRVRRLPEYLDPFDDNARRVASSQREVTVNDLEEAIRQLFFPKGTQIPNTALLYFSGHGLRRAWANRQKGYLATSDADPEQGQWGFPLEFLREVLQDSLIPEQVVWLDCCHSGELLNTPSSNEQVETNKFITQEEILKETEPNSRSRCSRSIIAASRGFEAAFEETLAKALLQGLDPNRRSDGWVTNRTLSDFIREELRTEVQCPVFSNSGNVIVLTRLQPEKYVDATQQGECPYKALQYFELADAHFFFGRTSLTDKLIHKISQTNFLAIAGPSGSGKSSVLRAGLLHELKLGHKLSGSEAWTYYGPFTPDKHPLKSLKQALGGNLDTLSDLSSAANKNRTLLIIDQFEECFTLCEKEEERQQFFDTLFNALDASQEKISIVIAIRADFLNHCAEYPRLLSFIRENAGLELVPAMDEEQLEEAIVEPARSVGLTVEPALVNHMIKDVEESRGSLPLLEFTLTEIWRTRREPFLDSLTLRAYDELGGVEGTLEKVANQVYDSFSNEEKRVAKQVFLRLVRLGEGSEVTRQRVLKSDLISSNHPETLVNQVVETLADRRLIVTDQDNEENLDLNGRGQTEIIDIAHESLVKHWKRLQNWIEENRPVIAKAEEINRDAKSWKEKNKPRKIAYLLQGKKLSEAKYYLKNHGDQNLLSGTAKEFIEISKNINKRRQVVILSISMAIFAVIGFQQWSAFRERQQASRTLTATLLGADVEPEALEEALPLFMEEANQQKGKIDKYVEVEQPDAALEYYHQNSEDINLAFTYYEKVLEEANDLLNQKGVELVHCDDSSTEESEVLAIRCDAEKHLADLLTAYRLPEIEDELKRERESEAEYFQGSLDITRHVLLIDTGADLDNDGQLDTYSEALQMPCDFLEKIEQLWMEYTRDTCRWYDNSNSPTSFNTANDCSQLGERTLALQVFNPRNYVLTIERIKLCRQEESILKLNEST